MSVINFTIHERRPFADGAAFGAAGAYERLDGVAEFAVRPDHPANRLITDLDLAERDAEGRVRFTADVCLFQPVAVERANRRLLLDIVNRGNKLIRMFNGGGGPAGPSERIDPGNGFLMRHGWTVVWCGWQWDVRRSPALLGLEAPRARVDSRLVEGPVSVTFQLNAPARAVMLSDRGHVPYPVADLGQPDALLLVRDGFRGARTVIARDRWRFARDEDGRPVPDPNHVWLDGGFEPGRVYEAVYRTNDCPVAGVGLLAERDIVSFLRHGDAAAGNPAAGRIDYAFGFGASQTGRFLRHFLYLGLNEDEQGRHVLDGALPHIAGSRRGEFNHRYAQPSAGTTTPGFTQVPPFTFDDQTDPYSGRTDGLLRRVRAAGHAPRIIVTNTTAEYWRGDASLLHIDGAAGRDIDLPAEVRAYCFAGTQHGPGALPLASATPDGARAAHPFNVVDYAPLLRAALVNLERWVTAGVEPPPSALPRLADGTAARPADVVEVFRAFPGAVVPDPALLPAVMSVDLGPEAERGIGRYPVEAGPPYPSFVPAVDTDGNDRAGIRLPDVAAPVATVTGWNPRHPDTGGAGQLHNMFGSTLPFAATAADRAAAGDPRPSIAERYRDREDYRARARAVAEELVRQRYLLAEDSERVVDAALARYDAFARVPAVAGDGA